MGRAPTLGGSGGTGGGEVSHVECMAVERCMTARIGGGGGGGYRWRRGKGVSVVARNRGCRRWRGIGEGCMAAGIGEVCTRAKHIPQRPCRHSCPSQRRDRRRGRQSPCSCRRAACGPAQRRAARPPRRGTAPWRRRCCVAARVLAQPGRRRAEGGPRAVAAGARQARRGEAGQDRTGRQGYAGQAMQDEVRIRLDAEAGRGPPLAILYTLNEA